ncbi:MFS transporter [Corynebacterium lizhenjunii]|uniref:MFS transporter n=2 Tax=Corynebacterium lizhenjunii TaxID=2709394 RepID=A0A7T0KFD3_9CORY|nr:MFS transporter [Corynebacterium lizhenjunii]
MHLMSPLSRLFPLFAILLAAANMRTAITGLSPLLAQIQTELGMSSTMVGLIGTVPTAMFAFGAFILPRIRQHLTLSQLMLAALLLSATGQALRVVYPSQWVLLAGSVAALCGIGALNAAMPLAVREYFPQRVPSVTMAYLLVCQLVLTAAPVLAVPFAARAGWQVAVGAWAVLALVAALAWAPLRSQQAVLADAPSFRLPVWRTPVGLGLAFLYGSNSLVAYTVMTFLPKVFIEAGRSAEFGAGMLGIWSAVGLPVVLAGPWLAGHLPRPFPVVVTAGAFFSVSLLGLAFAPLAAPVLWTVLSALGAIVFSMATVLVNLRARTAQGATSLTSFGQGVGYTIACVGPFATGALRQVSGSFAAPLAVLSVIGVVTVVAGFFATRPVYVEDQLARRAGTEGTTK